MISLDRVAQAVAVGWKKRPSRESEVQFNDESLVAYQSGAPRKLEHTQTIT